MKTSRREKNSLKEDFTKKITRPAEEVWFDVIPLSIDQSLFTEVRKDEKQELTRQWILWAFSKLNQNPERYGKPYQTMIPEKDWLEEKMACELEDIAEKKGSQMGWLLEQILEWPQRICNGESWEELCNRKDKSKWPRIVLKYPDALEYKVVGGGEEFNVASPTELGCTLSHYDPVQGVPFMVKYN